MTALFLPLLHSVWDKVIAGSCAVLVYVVVAILLSLKRQFLLIKTATEVTKLLNTVCLTSATGQGYIQDFEFEGGKSKVWH